MHTEPDLFVPWDQIPDYMHLEERRIADTQSADGEQASDVKREAKVDRQTAAGSVPQNTKSDRQITGGAKKSWKRFLPARTEKLKEGFRPSRNIAEYMSQLPSRSNRPAKPKKEEKEYLLVDGYNIIFCLGRVKRAVKDQH